MNIFFLPPNREKKRGIWKWKFEKNGLRIKKKKVNFCKFGNQRKIIKNSKFVDFFLFNSAFLKLRLDEEVIKKNKNTQNMIIIVLTNVKHTHTHTHTLVSQTKMKKTHMGHIWKTNVLGWLQSWGFTKRRKFGAGWKIRDSGDCVSDFFVMSIAVAVVWSYRARMYANEPLPPWRFHLKHSRGVVGGERL